MYFNFDDNHPDTPRIPSPMSRREVVLIAVNIHALVLIAILLGPRLPFVREIIEQRQKAIDEQLRAELERQKERERERARFVFVQPKLDVPTPKVAPRAEFVRPRSPGANRRACRTSDQSDAVLARQFSGATRGHAADRATTTGPRRGASAAVFYGVRQLLSVRPTRRGRPSAALRSA